MLFRKWKGRKPTRTVGRKKHGECSLRRRGLAWGDEKKHRIGNRPPETKPSNLEAKRKKEGKRRKDKD